MRIFIGSSSQALPLVREIAGWLEDAGHAPVCWDGVCAPGEYTFESLETLAPNVDGALLLLSYETASEAEQDTRAPNGNVLIELGLFCGSLGRRRVLICRDGNFKHPSDLSGITYVDVAQKRNKARGEIESWARSLAQRLPTDAPEHVKVHPSFPLAHFVDLLGQARCIRILQTFIPITEHLDHFEEALVQALGRGAEAEIMLCHHRSGACKIRQESLGPDAIDVKQAIELSFRRLGRMYQRLDPAVRCRLTVRAHSTLPSISLYQVNNVMFCGNYFWKTLAIHAPHLEVRASAEAKLARHVEREFDAIRMHPTTQEVDLEDVEGWLKL